jgi:hypothetical protein
MSRRPATAHQPCPICPPAEPVADTTTEESSNAGAEALGPLEGGAPDGRARARATRLTHSARIWALALLGVLAVSVLGWTATAGIAHASPSLAAPLWASVAEQGAEQDPTAWLNQKFTIARLFLMGVGGALTALTWTIAAIRYSTAGINDNAEQVEKAKQEFKHGFWGLVLLAAAPILVQLLEGAFGVPQ